MKNNILYILYLYDKAQVKIDIFAFYFSFITLGCQNRETELIRLLGSFIFKSKPILADHFTINNFFSPGH